MAKSATGDKFRKSQLLDVTSGWCCKVLLKCIIDLVNNINNCGEELLYFGKKKRKKSGTGESPMQEKKLLFNYLTENAKSAMIMPC